jgi:hypothetical protein
LIFEGEFFSGGHLRWNLGWQTPNYAGAFLATLLVFLWAFSGSRWRWVILAVETGGLFLLLKTYSRGAVLAWGVAWLFAIFALRVLRSRSGALRWMVSPVILAVLMFSVSFEWNRVRETGAQFEEVRGIDNAVVNRLALWRSGLQMSAAAPLSGWGAGEAGRAYMNWYQDLGRAEVYSTMVNSYLHVSVEYGTPMFALVLLAFGGLMTIAWRMANDKSAPSTILGVDRHYLIAAAGASVMAWAVANVFTTLWIEPMLWVAPGAACLFLILIFLKGDWRNLSKSALMIGLFIAVLSTGSLHVLRGSWLRPKEKSFRIAPTGLGAVTISQSGADSAEWHAWPDVSVLGPTPGKEFRIWMEVMDVHLLRLTVHQVVPRSSSGVLAKKEGVILFGRHSERVRQEIALKPENLWVIHPTVEPPTGVAVVSGGESPTLITVLLPEIDEVGINSAWQFWAEQNMARVVSSPNCGVDIRAVWPDVLKGISSTTVASKAHD